MKTTAKVSIKGMEFTTDGGVAFLANPNKVSPKTGTIVVNEVQARRIARRCLGIENLIGLKHLISLSNGSAVISVDLLDCKAGDAYTKADKSTGTYTKDHIQQNNHEVTLGVVAQLELTRMSLQNAFQNPSYTVAQPKAVVAIQEEPKAEDNQEEPTA